MDALLPAAAARTPGFGLAWGAVMLLVLAVPAWHWYSPSARGITVAVTQVAQMASGASKLSEGPLLVPGCPAWVAVAGPYAAAVVLGILGMVLTANGRPALARVALAAWPLAAIWGKAYCDAWAYFKPAGLEQVPRYKLTVSVPHMIEARSMPGSYGRHAGGPPTPNHAALGSAAVRVAILTDVLLSGPFGHPCPALAVCQNTVLAVFIETPLMILQCMCFYHQGGVLRPVRRKLSKAGCCKQPTDVQALERFLGIVLRQRDRALYQVPSCHSDTWIAACRQPMTPG